MNTKNNEDLKFQLKSFTENEAFLYSVHAKLSLSVYEYTFARVPLVHS